MGAIFFVRHAIGHAISRFDSSATINGVAAIFMERSKTAKYANTEWPATVPFVLESTGYLGKCAEVLLEKLTRDRSHLLKWFKGELSLILARCEGRMRMHSQSMLVV